MMPAEYVFAILLMLTKPIPVDPNEGEGGRAKRLFDMAEAITDVSSSASCQGKYKKDTCKRIWPGKQKDLALLLVTKAYWESALSYRVHSGNCAKWECDATKIGGVIFHRARTPWQLQQTGLVSREEWNTMVGTSYKETRVAAKVAARILSRHYRACGTIQGAISRYAGVKGCTWDKANVRYAFFEKLRAKTPEELEKYLGKTNPE